jgi:hypothetical protein
MKHLDGKATWSGEVERSGPVHVLGLKELHSRRLQPIVAVIHFAGDNGRGVASCWLNEKESGQANQARPRS